MAKRDTASGDVVFSNGNDEMVRAPASVVVLHEVMGSSLELQADPVQALEDVTVAGRLFWRGVDVVDAITSLFPPPPAPPSTPAGYNVTYNFTYTYNNSANYFVNAGNIVGIALNADFGSVGYTAQTNIIELWHVLESCMDSTADAPTLTDTSTGGGLVLNFKSDASTVLEAHQLPNAAVSPGTVWTGDYDINGITVTLNGWDMTNGGGCEKIFVLEPA